MGDADPGSGTPRTVPATPGRSRCHARRSSTTVEISASTKCGSRNFSCNEPPQRISGAEAIRHLANRATSAPPAVLDERHLGVRRHFEGTELEQSQPAAQSVGVVELVDAELGSVAVPRDVGEQIAQKRGPPPRVGGRCRRASRSRRRRSRVRRASRDGPRPPVAPGWSVPRSDLENR